MPTLDALAFTLLVDEARITILLGALLLMLSAFAGAPRSRHAALLCAALACLLMPVLSATLPALPMPDIQVPAWPQAGGEAAIAGAPAAGSAATANPAQRFALPALALYLSVALLLIVRAIIRRIALARRARAWTLPVPTVIARRAQQLARAAGIARTVRLSMGHDVVSPATWGWLRPRIVLPHAARDWPPECVEQALRHELAHVRRGDWAVDQLMAVLCALHWFNPLVWLLRARLSLESERCCDEAVLRAGGRPSSYASLLVSLARRQPLEGALAGSGRGRSELGIRVHQILKLHNQRYPSMPDRPAMAALGVAASAALLAACQSAAVAADPPARAGITAADARVVIRHDEGGPVAKTPGDASPLVAIPAPAQSAVPAPAPVIAPAPVVTPAPDVAPAPAPAVRPDTSPRPELAVAPPSPPQPESDARKRELAQQAQRLEAEKAELAREVERHRAELRELEKALDAERAALAHEAAATRRELAEARRQVAAEQRHLERERELLERETRTRERERRRLELEDEDRP